MSNVMSQLKFVTQQKPATTASTVSPEQRRQNALVARLDEQIALATAHIEGKTFTATRTKTVTNKETGEKTKQQAAKHVTPWWWQAGKSFFVQIRYGASILTFKGGTNSIEATSLKNVVIVLTTLKQAVAAGELDGPIAQVVSKRGTKKETKETKAAAK